MFSIAVILQDDNAYNTWVELYRPSWADLFRQLPSLKVPAQYVLTELPILQPRFYSISSCPITNPDEVHLTVSVLEYKIGTGKF